MQTLNCGQKLPPKPANLRSLLMIPNNFTCCYTIVNKPSTKSSMKSVDFKFSFAHNSLNDRAGSGSFLAQVELQALFLARRGPDLRP